jgi:hypothetical protein
VEGHQAASWLVKQRNYLENYILPFFDGATLTTHLTPRRIRDYVDWRKTEGKIRSVTVNKELPRSKPAYDLPKSAATCSKARLARFGSCRAIPSFMTGSSPKTNL